jgi:hypothetical protein
MAYSRENIVVLLITYLREKIKLGVVGHNRRWVITGGGSNPRSSFLSIIYFIEWI